MAKLLVSVRSAAEALAALAGGAAVVDVKEPDRGALGRADPAVWTAVRAAVPVSIPVSVALGELRDWPVDEGELLIDWSGVSFRKIGLAGEGADPGWVDRWAEVRSRSAAGPSWIAVAYADWRRAEAPSPDDVLDAATAAEDCAGILVDTWDKSHPSPVDLGWSGWFDRARESGRMTALAGRLDLDGIARLAPLRPDLIAVRGAACPGGDRRAGVDAGLVAGLARAAALVGGLPVQNRSA